MKRKKFSRRFAAGIPALLFFALLVSGIYAKYIRTVSKPAEVTFYTNIAEDIRLAEHGAVKNADGTYVLNKKEVENNHYLVMPGVDIPKDPQVIIEAKSVVESFLYLEVSGACPASVSFGLEDHWIALDGIAGKHGGQVYVYGKKGQGALPLDENFSEESIKILKGDVVHVSETYQEEEEFSLCFYGYMAQIPPGEEEKPAADLFSSNFSE